MSYPPTYQENGTSWDAFPIHLPGGEAMVRTVGGILSFITDAHRCCCVTTTTTTTLPPDACEHCADTYYWTLSGTAAAMDCDYSYSLHRSADNPCLWEGQCDGCGRDGYNCYVRLWAVAEDRWRLAVLYPTPDWQLDPYACQYDRVVASVYEDCPEGEYAFTTGSYDFCPEGNQIVTVTP